MEFGRIEDSEKLNRIHWRLAPLDSAKEIIQLERVKRAAEKDSREQEIRIGLPVWGESKWVGALYPSGTKSEDFLKQYSRQFSLVEINSTFYTIPSAETFQKWAESVFGDFKFCPKFPQSITRSLTAGLDVSELPTFIQRSHELGSHFGFSFLQLPPAFSLESISRLERLLGQIPRDMRAMVEFRHPSFFEDQRLKPEIVDLLAKHRAGTVITDTAQFREYAHASLSSTRVLIRFAASNGHPSDFTRLDQWAERIRLWYEWGMKEIYFTVHATEAIPQIEAARYFIQKLNQELNAQSLSYSIPEPHFFHDEQGSLFL